MTPESGGLVFCRCFQVIQLGCKKTKKSFLVEPCLRKSQFGTCLSTDLILHQTVASESLSVDTFDYKNDVYVTIGAPSTDCCMVFQWDHIEMNFRTYDNITGISAL